MGRNAGRKAVGAGGLLIKAGRRQADTAHVEGTTTRSAAAAAARDARRAAVQRGTFTLGLFVFLVAGLALGLDIWAFIVLQMALLVAVGVADHLGRASRRRKEAAVSADTVANVLDGLRERGWRTLDDVDLGRGVIDHVLIGPAGVFAVEVTPADRAPERAQLDELAVRRVHRHALAMEELAGRAVVPLLVLAGARSGSAVVLPHGVIAVPSRRLAAHLRRRTAVLGERDAVELSARLRSLVERPARAAG